MSVKASHWAWQQALPPAQKVVLLALADHSDDNGKCWPSVRLLAAKSCSSTRTVQRVIRALQDAGLVSVKSQPRPGSNAQTSNLYTLALPVALSN
jgi:DNA-binding MarR family transcriptional regulator